MTNHATTYAALITVSLSVGYWAGMRWALRAASSASRPSSSNERLKIDRDNDPNSEAGSDTSEALPDEDLASVKANLLEDCKLALVVRTDLGMSSGKTAAQCSHATLACYKALSKSNPAVGNFMSSILLSAYGFTHAVQASATLGKNGSKVALRADNKEELDTLEAMARSLNLCARSIHDAGRTQIAAGSRTVLGIGPGPARLVNQVTGKLRLL